MGIFEGKSSLDFDDLSNNALKERKKMFKPHKNPIENRQIVENSIGFLLDDSEWNKTEKWYMSKPEWKQHFSEIKRESREAIKQLADKQAAQLAQTARQEKTRAREARIAKLRSRLHVEEVETPTPLFDADFLSGKCLWETSKDIPFEFGDQNGDINFYEVTGEVDMEKHSATKKRSDEWYAKKDNAAGLLYNHSIYFEFSAGGFNKARMVEIYDVVEGGLNKDSIAKLIADGKATKAEIYGPKGLFNCLLAVQRAVSPLLKKGYLWEDIGIILNTPQNLKDSATDLSELKGTRIEKFVIKLAKRKMSVKKTAVVKIIPTGGGADRDRTPATPPQTGGSSDRDRTE